MSRYDPEPTSFSACWQAIVIQPAGVVVVDPGPGWEKASIAADSHPAALVAFRPVRPVPRPSYAGDEF